MTGEFLESAGAGRRAKPSVLLLEDIAPTALQTFADAGFTDVQLEKTAFEADALTPRLARVEVLGVRSRSKITREVLNAAPHLLALGCFSVGTNQVDLDAARRLGVPVFNAPFSNTRSVAELTIAEIVMLYRGVFSKSLAAHQGAWLKSAAGSHEVRGKTLGIVGYGNIGAQVSVLAEAMGMRVIYFDHVDKLPHGMARPVASLDALLSEADVLTLHLPATAETRGIIGPAEIAKMKPGAFLLNNARGSLVDLDALADALWSGQVAGAAVDVFPVEPKSKAEPLETPLRGLENVILTPHIGGATQEAQQQIGLEVARKLTAYIEHGSTIGAVNLPQAQLPAPVGVTRFLQLAANPASALERMAAAFAQRALPIVAQHCFGDAEIGYVVVDVAGDLPHAEEIERELRAAPHAIRVRALRPTAGVAAHLDPIRLAS